jgi:hypothetical protein
MPRELKRTLGKTTLSVRLWTLKDKKSPMFRARYDDVHIVEVTAKSEKHNVILRTQQFSDYAQAKQWYEMYLNAFGHSLEFIKQKQSS